MVRVYKIILTVAFSLFLVTGAYARDSILSCFFAGTTSNNDLFLATSPGDISGSYRVVLYGVKIPTKCSTNFNKYLQKMLGGNLLHVRIKRRLDDKSIPAMVGEVMIVQGKHYVNFNKTVLRDGYGILAPNAPSEYAQFVAYARSKHRGLYSVGRPNWIFPVIEKEAEPAVRGAVLDRDKTIARYGLPNYSNRCTIPDNYSLMQYHIYITDFYLGIGKCFIYRDGKLVNNSDYGK